MLGIAIGILASSPQSLEKYSSRGARCDSDRQGSAVAGGAGLRGGIAVEVVLDLEALDIGLGGGLRVAAGSQHRDPEPILARARNIAAQPAQIAALQQRRHRIRGSCQRLIEVGERRVEATQRAVGGGAVYQGVE